MTEKKSHKKVYRLWFLDTTEGVKGPYPTKQLRQYLLLGRLSAHHKVSLDQIEWVPMGELQEFKTKMGLAEVLSPEDQHELAMRNADERGGVDRRLELAEELNDNHDDQRSDAGGRREVEMAMGTRHYRQSESIYAASIAGKRWLNLLVAFILFIPTMAVFILYRGDILPKQRDCAAVAAPGVNWNSCTKSQQDFSNLNLSGAVMSSMKLVAARFHNANLQKADLSFSILASAGLNNANLQQAKLVGTSLEFATLTKANVTGADLSYANLVGAHIEGVNFSGAKMDKAVWVDGRICAVGSVGKCN